ncbi:MAG TPA: hypothetical protein PKC30_02050 [Saprospiraceae bacterium]|nr:hypothetical protein [Saprospiraceae bacterium]
MNKPFIEIDAEHFTLSAFEAKPIEGYEPPTNKETGEQFPNCCPFHKSVFEKAESWFSKFPNCCDQHKAMVSKWWYNKANYSGIAEKIVKQLSYTEHHISERINIDDWYKDITDYIEYNVSSFGHPAIGLHLYLGNVQHYIKNTKSEIPNDKRQRLIEFTETYYNNPKEHPNTDLNILYSTYQKWLKVFPFEISFFSTLKPHFEKQLPILNGKPETNKYTGIAKAKMHTKGSLIDVLLNLTNNLLTQINTTTLYEKGLLTEPQKIKLELVLNERKMKLKQGYVNSSKDEEQRYRKILKEWFADEKRFIDEVTPLVKALPPQPIVESSFSVLEWATIFYYADETKLLSEGRLLKTRLEQFMSKHQVNTTFENFKTKYYEAKKRINKKNDYPINKLELIIPFLKENYKQTVTKVENEIIFLKENKPDY